MGKAIRHMCIDVRGALMNFKAREWRNCCTDRETGRILTPQEVKAELLAELAKGRVVIPFGEPCEGFDYSGSGCPGHRVEDELSTTPQESTP